MWYQIKEPVVQFLGLSRDALHVHLGLAIFVILALLLRRVPNSLVYAWVALFALQTANELLDLYDWYIWTQSLNWRKSAGDYLHTMFWPTILLAIGKWKAP